MRKLRVGILGLTLLAPGCPHPTPPPDGTDAGLTASGGQMGAGPPPMMGVPIQLVVPSVGVPAPINLARVVVAAPMVLPGVELVDAEGLPVPARVLAGETLACGQPFCAGWQLASALAPGASYRVRAGPSEVAFDVGMTADFSAPTVLPPTLEVEGPCAIMRVVADEPVTVELRSNADESIARRDVAALEQELASRPAQGPEVTLLVRDLAGNEARAELPYEPPAGTEPRLAITELLVNPRGPEPAQEWIELRNLGDKSVSTEGLEVRAGAGSDGLPAALIAVGGYGLVVPAGFQTGGGDDTPPARDAVLLRIVGPTLGSGLSNSAGQAVELRDAMGQVVSRYGGFLDFSARVSAGLSAARIDEQGCDLRANWRVAVHPTPGSGNQF